MADSALAVTYTDLLTDVGFFLGWGGDSTAWDTGKTATVASIIRSGYRQFLYPPTLGEKTRHVWSFLRKVSTLYAWPAIAGSPTSALSRTGSGSYVTYLIDTATTFYSNMVGKSLAFDTSGSSYVIAEYVSPTQIGLTGDATGEGLDSYTITPDGDYDMPDDFGALDGPITYPANNLYDRLLIVGEGLIRSKRTLTTSAGHPIFAAIRPKACDGTIGQRYEILLWPTPDAVYELLCPYYVNPAELTATAPYPLGGLDHADVIRESCLAEAEHRLNDAQGIHKAKFMELLQASISDDNNLQEPDFYGSINRTSQIRDRREYQVATITIGNPP